MQWCVKGPIKAAVEILWCDIRAGTRSIDTSVSVPGYRFAEGTIGVVNCLFSAETFSFRLPGGGGGSISEELPDKRHASPVGTPFVVHLVARRVRRGHWGVTVSYFFTRRVLGEMGGWVRSEKLLKRKAPQTNRGTPMIHP